MKITTLIENGNTGHEELICEHGLSFFLEVQGKKLLFDTGATGAFIDNAKALGIDLAATDEVIISHAHFDHSGGVKRLLAEYPAVRSFVLAQEYFEPKYKRIGEEVRYIGSRFDQKDLEQADARVLWVSATTALCRGVYLIKGFMRDTAYETMNPDFVLADKMGGYCTDPFEDEIALAVETPHGLVVVVGCSHCGVVNLLHTVSAVLHKPIYGVVGGSHLMDAPDSRIQQTVADLKQMGLRRLWLSHCTGEGAAACFAEAFGHAYQDNHTGSVIEL